MTRTHQAKPADAIERAASLSACQAYRYTLARRWGDGPPVLFVMLNPSTADAWRDDPTVRRCIGFARTWGFNALAVANLFAYRTPSPLALAVAEQEGRDIVGPDNDAALATLARQAGKIILGWGAHGETYPYRVNRTLAVLRDAARQPFECLGLTAASEPRHPLYVHGGQVPFVYWTAHQPTNPKPQENATHDGN